MSRAPAPKPLDRYLQELYAAKEEQRRRDARLGFEEKVEIVLELQEASRLVREGRHGRNQADGDSGQLSPPKT